MVSAEADSEAAGQNGTAGAHGCAFRAIAMIGLGLVGASFAAAIKRAYPDARVLGCDLDARARDETVARGWVDEACASDDAVLESFVRESCDLFVIATPASAAPDYFRMLASWGYDGIVTDTASTKSRIAGVARDALPHLENYVPGHPMAGSEVNGIDGARPDLFSGAHWILCSDADTPPEHFTRLHELVTGIGARVVSLPREGHDAAVAIVSHVPHVVASSLMELASRHADDQLSLMRLAAGGFKDSDLFQDFGHASGRDHAASGTLSGFGAVRSKNAPILPAGVW